MGHDAEIVAYSDKFTWFKHRPVIRKIPHDTEALIACSISDVAGISVFGQKEAPKSKNFFWMRGWETWQMSEEHIVNRLKLGQHNIVNSTWLKRRLEGLGIASDLVWQGADIDFWYDPHFVRQENKKIRIGCLFNKHHKTKRWDLFLKLQEYLGYDRYEYWSFGSDKCRDKINCYLRQPNAEALRTFYRNIDIWFAPTELEGFPNTPIEASLCGCLLVCKKIDSNGMEDIANADTAMQYETFDDAIGFLKQPDFSKVPKMQELIINKIGDRRTNMERLVEILKK